MDTRLTNFTPERIKLTEYVYFAHIYKTKGQLVEQSK